ncbi:MAG: hypothetical protein M3X11_16565, partial [Acidobacteriota bacterium]|nr:hypothetical protein [Acidobacteriota bacterium]
PAELEKLNPEAIAKWRQMLQTHALAVERETAALRAQLQPIFFAATEPDSPANSGGELNLKQAVERLVALTANHDAVVGQAFARSTTPASAAMLKSQQFRQSLLEAEALAKEVSKR